MLIPIDLLQDTLDRASQLNIRDGCDTLVVAIPKRTASYHGTSGVSTSAEKPRLLNLVRVEPEIKGDSEWALKIEDNAKLKEVASELLSACEAIAEGMIKMQGFIPHFLDAVIKKARGTES